MRINPYPPQKLQSPSPLHPKKITTFKNLTKTLPNETPRHPKQNQHH